MLPRNLHLPGQRNRIEQPAHLIGFEDRRDAYLAAELRALHEEGRVLGNDLLNDEPIEEAAQGGEVLFDGWRGQRLAFDIGGDVKRQDGGQLQLVLLAPAEVLRRGLNIGCAGVGIADRCREEFEEVLARFLPGIGDDCWNGKSPRRGRAGAGRD